MAITPAGFSAKPRVNRVKQAPNNFGSSSRNTRLNMSWGKEFC